MAAISFPRIFGNLTTALLSYLDDNFNAINSAISATPGSGIIPVAGSDGSLASGWAGLMNVQVLTSGTIYVPAAGTHKIIVELVGGGGAGGGAVVTTAGIVSGGAGGGAGAYIRKLFTSISGTYSYSIGSAGAGSSGAAGGNGGNTTFTGPGSVTLTAAAGSGGGASAAGTNQSVFPGGAGGTATNGDVQFTGSAGGGLIGQVSGSLYIGTSGSGGNSFFGAGGAGIPANAVAAAAAASGYGAGGGGAFNPANSSARAGGNGTQGIIIVWEFS